MAELTDDEALAEVEKALWTYRAFTRIDELVRFIRNARKDFPDLQAKIADLQSQIERAQTEAGAAQAALVSVRADTQPQIASLTDARDQLADEVARLQRDGSAATQRLAALRSQVQEAEASLATLSASVASLTEEENILRVKVTEHEEAIAQIRDNAARLAGG